MRRSAYGPAVASLLAAISGCGDAAGRPGSVSAMEGAALIREYGCHSCHTVRGIVGANGRIGPPLSDLGGRVYIAGSLPNTPDNLVRWIMNPRDVHAHTAMPDLGVTEEHARQIAAYLYSLP